MEKLRWGVIGAGGIADRRPIPGMMEAYNAELVAVMEINMEFAEKLRAKYNAKRAYDSAEALLKDPEVDAVYIASPVVLHAQQAMAAADAGKHIPVSYTHLDVYKRQGGRSLSLPSDPFKSRKRSFPEV